MHKRTEYWKNGDCFTPVQYYTCNHCDKEICESFPHFIDRESDYHACWDCSFVQGYIDEQAYLRSSGVTLTNARAAIYEGKVHVWAGNRAPWEQRLSDERKSSRYRKWRENVLTRDGHRCRNCNSTRCLEAHHIKPFAKFKELRYLVSNGLTLCIACHRKVHSKSG